MSDLIPKHGGYRNLKSFQISQLVYDITVRFTELYIDKFSRTKDQMVRAARSGVQNIAEGSQASATSKKTELKLTQVARASLEELKLDYEDYLRQNKLNQLHYEDSVLKRFKETRCSTLNHVQQWIKHERQVSTRYNHSCLAANAALSLINLACYLLDKQVTTLANRFENEGGFTERLYKVRRNKRNY